MAPVCVACNAVITVKQILIECADLLEIKIKKTFRREIFAFTLSERKSGILFFLFLARDWCVLYNMKWVKVLCVLSVLKEKCLKFSWKYFTICLMNN